ncbi:dihydrofolate reductase-like domain-containing protein [Gamsiella multidivaricata]|uniref:dihydrofolate reductase-like domain-containing protein n=1 Tax=Gamsiella multidivaricata TaxID=101098 RepID=UPI0022203A2B|nr:dihydrofolate reductase-like domain-containing protein [Gamsiella multidivaricata]KAI7831101.1 dihydrofolate reductase-like domain-containing protein [Gamsiella multidivaricata]
MATADYRFLFDSSFAPDKDLQRPHVTLTFAQSLDGKIAGRQGRQLILSGPESMKATHILRSKHDAILVGIGTVLNDDPRLTVRLNSDDLQPGSDPVQHPQPVILDSTFRFPVTAKLVLPTSPKKPWIFTGPAHDHQRRSELEALGARVFVLGVDSDGRLSIPDLLSKLRQQSIRSLMVEGGAGIISSFLRSGLVDSFLLTIAPVYVGHEGVSAVQDAEAAAKFDKISYHTLGRDVMMVARPQRD